MVERGEGEGRIFARLGSASSSSFQGLGNICCDHVLHRSRCTRDIICSIARAAFTCAVHYLPEGKACSVKVLCETGVCRLSFFCSLG